MHPIYSFAIFLIFAFLLTHELEAQAFINGGGGPIQKDARLLDELIQLNAFRSLAKPRTGVVYSVKLPSILKGIRASIVRLRCGSLHRKGFNHFHEFHLPRYLHQRPSSLRIALIYHNLGNWSSTYYSLPGHRFLTPVLGLLAYEATELGSTHHQEMGILPSETPILINFKNLGRIPDELAPKCVQFFTDGSHRLHDSKNGGACCEAFSLGHYSIVVESAPPQSQPPPRRPPLGGDGGGRRGFKFERMWRIVAALVGGLMGAVVVIMILLCFRCSRRREMGDMMSKSEGGEVLRSQNVGSARLPVGSFARTPPMLEEEDVP